MTVTGDLDGGHLVALPLQAGQSEMPPETSMTSPLM